MTYEPQHPIRAKNTLAAMPQWVTTTPGKSTDHVAFMSGAAMATLHFAISTPTDHNALFRQRLALRAAARCAQNFGLAADAAQMRDEVHLARPGEALGPGGALFARYAQAVRTRLGSGLAQDARHLCPESHFDLGVSTFKSARNNPPVAAAAQALEASLQADPRDEVTALILADAVLARAARWPHLVPLLSASLRSRDLGKTGPELLTACHHAIADLAAELVQLAADLARRVQRLQAAVPRLRAKQAGAAIDLFLTRDAVSPSVALAPLMGSDAGECRILR